MLSNFIRNSMIFFVFRFYLFTFVLKWCCGGDAKGVAGDDCDEGRKRRRKKRRMVMKEVETNKWK